jgi:hypothetical protein
MICILAATIADAQEFITNHPDLDNQNYVVVTPDNYREMMANLFFSDIISTDKFLAVPNQHEIWIQARSRLTGQSTHRFRK